MAHSHRNHSWPLRGPSGSENEPLCAFIISEGKRAETCWLLRGFDSYSESVAERLNREMIKTIADAKRMELGEYMNERRGVFSEGVGRHFDFGFVYWKSHTRPFHPVNL